jgi:hypothetical protein
MKENKMRSILFVFSLLFLFALQSCDYDFQDLGDGFSFGYVNVSEANNVYYENVGLINDGKLDEVRWNDNYILVHTINNKWILIDKAKVINHESEDVSVKDVSYSSVKNMEFDDYIKI